MLNSAAGASSPGADRFGDAWAVITEDERERADRLVRQEDRVVWVEARAVLRTLLAHYLSGEPTSVVFGEGEHGKPTVAAPRDGGRLEFNVSHSGTVAVIAIAEGRRVGIDVEQVDPGVAWESVAGRLFSAADIARLESSPPAERALAFFECWVSKESYLKGIGVGLTRPLGTFSVPVGGTGGPVDDPGTTARSGSRGDWWVEPVGVPQGYVAALAVEGRCGVETGDIWPEGLPLR